MSRRPSGMTSFETSAWFDYNVFRAAVPEWDDHKAKYWYEQALSYSESKGAKYANWVSAVKSWDRKDPDQYLKYRKRNPSPKPQWPGASSVGEQPQQATQDAAASSIDKIRGLLGK